MQIKYLLHSLVRAGDSLTSLSDDYYIPIDTGANLSYKATLSTLADYILEQSSDSSTTSSAVDLSGETTTLSGALPITYGGTGGTSEDAALCNIISGLTTNYYVSPSSYYIPMGYTSSDVNYARRMRPNYLFNTMVAGASSNFTMSNVSSSLYFLLAQGYTSTATSSSSKTAYKITPDDLLSWIEDNISTSSGTTIVTGTYEGNSEDDTGDATTTVTLGSQPKFVWVGYISDYSSASGKRYAPWYTYNSDNLVTVNRSGYAMPDYPWNGRPSDYSSSDDILAALEITSTGFTVCDLEYEYSSGTQVNQLLNSSGLTYFYLAIL